MAAISVRNLVKRFEGSTVAVDGVSFDVPDGTVTTLLGPSGCGKTTTLRLIAGLEIPDDGAIVAGGRVLASVPDGVFLPPEQRDAGMVFQSYAIWPHMTVAENVGYPLRIREVPRREVAERVSAVLALLKLSGLEERAATKLSGGQQQRVAIARALIGRPALLLLDEPLANLDAKLRGHMRVELRDLQRRLGITTIYVTHDQAEAMVLSDQVIVMQDGRIQQAASPREVYARPANPFVADFVGFTNFLPGKLVEQQGEAALVRLVGEGPLVRCRNGGGRLGQEVVVAARPSALRYEPANGAVGGDALAGEVTSLLYVGDACECHVQVGERRLVGLVPDPPTLAGQPYRVGDRVTVCFDADKTVAMPA